MKSAAIFLVCLLVGGVDLNKLDQGDHHPHEGEHLHEWEEGVEEREGKSVSQGVQEVDNSLAGYGELETQIFGSSRGGYGSVETEEDAINVYGAATEEPQDLPISGAIDFSRATAVEQSDGSVKYCVHKTETRDQLVKDPVLECIHKTVEKCHFTYKTQFFPVQEEACEDNYVKLCTISYKQVAINETINHCYQPLVKDCTVKPATGEELCREYYESSCTTKYIEEAPGRYVGDTSCERLPVQLCGDSTCRVVEGPEECHDKVVVSVIDEPEEHCELSPQKTCRHKTTLVPKLHPETECTQVPREVCTIKYVNSRIEKVPFKSLWCQYDPSPEVEFNQLSEGVTTEESLTAYRPSETTEAGYSYVVPVKPLNPPRPVQKSPETQVNLPEPVTGQQVKLLQDPLPLQSPGAGKTSVVGLRPEELELAVTTSVKQAVADAVNKATVIAESQESKQKLSTAVAASVEQAVRASLKSSVESQVASQRPQSSAALEGTLKTAINTAVEESVRKALSIQGDDENMSTEMKAELNDMKFSIQVNLVEAVRAAVKKSLDKAFQSQVFGGSRQQAVLPLQQQLVGGQTLSTPLQNVIQQPIITQQQSVQESVLLARTVEEVVQGAVQRAVQLSVQQRTEAEQQAARIAIQQAVNQAVDISIRKTLESKPTQQLDADVRSAVEQNVMTAVRNSLLTATNRSRATLQQKQLLSAALRQAVQQAIEKAVRSNRY